MKRIFVAAATIVAAYGGSAFTTATSAVWFQLDPSSGLPNTAVKPTAAQPTCTGSGAFCARQYTSYITQAANDYIPGASVPSTTLVKS